MSRNEHNPNKGASQSVAPRAIFYAARSQRQNSSPNTISAFSDARRPHPRPLSQRERGVSDPIRPHPRPLSQRERGVVVGRPGGFTLVELLVVVTIIAMLVGLLMPAVMASRAKARMVQCTNNQKELATAIFSYENAKRHLPGFVNRVNRTQVSWVPVLFPYLGRMDLWEGPNGWRDGTGTTGYIGQLVCPNDVTNTGVASLSYVVELGTCTDLTDPLNNVSAFGVFRDYYNNPSTTAITLSDIRSPAQTVMISEYHIPPSNPPRLWSAPLPVDVGFFWPDPNTSALNATLIGRTLPGLPAPLQAAHRGMAIVTFCDGHVEEIPEDTPCNLYYGAW